MTEYLIILNLTIMALIFGYAFAATTVSYPAMMASSRATGVEYFKPFFHKSKDLQLILSVVVWLLSFAISYFTGNWWWFGGATFLQLAGPYTIFVLMPVNNRVMAEGADIDSDQMTKDLKSWGKLHFPRTVNAGIVFLLFAYLAVFGS